MYYARLAYQLKIQRNAMPNLTSIDQIIQDLKLSIGLSDEQAEIIAFNEVNAMLSERKSDAKIDVAQLLKDNPERIFIEMVLSSTKDNMFELLNSYPSNGNPFLHLITGAPGSGKSMLSEYTQCNDTSSIYLCGDEVKKEFHKILDLNVMTCGLEFETLAKYKSATYIHRLTSGITWDIFDASLKEKKNIILEIIGTDAESDSDSIKKAKLNGYSVHLHHVACRQEKAISRAIERFFSTSAKDSGRYISLTNISNKHEKILETFNKMIENLKGIDCNATLYDNSQWEMKPLYQCNLLHNFSLPNITQLTKEKINEGLWYKGENHSSDLLAFSYDSDNQLNIAMIVRGKFPFAGYAALPGGFVNTAAKRGEEYVLGLEDPKDAALREFAEETLFSMASDVELIPVGTYDNKNRDPRNTKESSVTSHAFGMIHPEMFELIGSDDALSARWIKVEDILSLHLKSAFDHKTMIEDAVRILKLDLINQNTANLKMSP
jgi:ADP-ribose pyrophosphatase YjhB (NUDIX family)/predicted ABC-type ATPase